MVASGIVFMGLCIRGRTGCDRLYKTIEGTQRERFACGMLCIAKLSRYGLPVLQHRVMFVSGSTTRESSLFWTMWSVIR